MPNKKTNIQLLYLINQLLTENIPSNESSILIKAKHELENQRYLPKIISELKQDLTPLAATGKLSKETGKFYLAITNYPFSNNNLGGGLISAFGNSLKG